jgi:hypothetical protein
LAGILVDHWNWIKFQFHGGPNGLSSRIQLRKQICEISGLLFLPKV